MMPERSDIPPGYRMTELGPLPEEWQVVRLGEVLTPVYKKLRETLVEDDKVYRLLTVRLYAKGITLRSEEKGNRIKTKKLYCTKSGDFVFSKIDARNGAWGFVTDELEGGLVSGDFPILTLERHKADQSFIELQLAQPTVWEPLRNIAVGTTNRRRLHTFQLLQVAVALPPLAEQRAIAHVLRTVQEAKEATERVIAALKELKRSLMRHLFTYGPVPLDQTEAVELQETEIGPLPTHWRVVRLEEVFDIQQGKALSRKKDKGLRPRPFLRTANVFWGRLDLSNLDQMDFSEEEEKKYALRPGDLLVCEGGDVGRTAIWEGQLKDVYYQNHLHRLRAKSQDVEPRFVMYWMQTAMTLLGLYLGTSNKTTIPNLSRSRLASFAIPLPPLPEQQEIARMLQAVDARIEAEEKKKAALEALFKTLLHHLMTAKVRVPEEFVARFAEVLP